MTIGLLPVLGGLIALYTLYAACTGSIYVRSGVAGRRVFRSEEPGTFWLTIVVYLGLSGMLLVFALAE